MTVLDIILEPPEYLEPVARWEEWLADLRTLPQEADGVAREIADAEKWIPQRIELEKQLQAMSAAEARKVAA
ncbi:MAG: hypothetical protein FWH15_06260 [Betaproteobacteria bacterium]|nr:hypothetical protein [Betaproteobacteria bacterium]